MFLFPQDLEASVLAAAHGLINVLTQNLHRTSATQQHSAGSLHQGTMIQPALAHEPKHTVQEEMTRFEFISIFLIFFGPLQKRF